VVTAILVLDALRLRSRLRSMESVAPAHDASAHADPDHAFVAGVGVELGEPTRAAASAHASHHDLDVLDLVPADFGSERLLDLARLVDPARDRTNPLAAGWGPGQATLVHRAVLARAGATEGGAVDLGTSARLVAEFKKCAPLRTGIGIGPGLRAGPDDRNQRRASLLRRYGKAAPLFASPPVLYAGLVAAGLLTAPVWGVAALAASVAQPYIALAGTPLRPRDLTPVRSLGRPLTRALDAVRLAAGGPGAAAGGREEELSAEQRSAEYDELLAAGTARFFEPRRSTCPLCSAPTVVERLRATDLIQFKPGSFELDECTSCGHVFQNPRLSLEGLDFYYRDFYDGADSEALEIVFTADDTSYRGRAELVSAHVRPKRWLDVGAGHGHFCLLASTLLPETRFEALDLSRSIADAERRQWVERAHLGLFPDLAEELTGAFDVVSMHHYLEHTRDPAAELKAAATVLEAGGYLCIEVPDPESAFGRWFGALWGPWFQPQHQHLLSVRNLVSLLGEQGFTMVAEERGPAHQPNDLAFATLLLANRVAGAPAMPWLPPPSVAARMRRGVSFTLLAPLTVPALVLDRLLAPVIRSRPGGPNTYRVLARKHEPPLGSSGGRS
jgi:SAM-dependent methyltransferase